MIRRYKSAAAQAISEDTGIPAGISPKFARVARRKLVQLDAAVKLNDLAFPPGNKLEALKGKLKDFHSIRINKQYRIVFRWTDAGPEDVDIADYR